MKYNKSPLFLYLSSLFSCSSLCGVQFLQTNKSVILVSLCYFFPLIRLLCMIMIQKVSQSHMHAHGNLINYHYVFSYQMFQIKPIINLNHPIFFLFVNFTRGVQYNTKQNKTGWYINTRGMSEREGRKLLTKMQGRITKKETETHSTMPPLSQIPPSSSSSFPHPSSIAEATANTTTTRKRVKRMVHSHCGSINMERERRSKMTQMFTQLQTSVPGLLPQVHSSIIDHHPTFHFLPISWFLGVLVKWVLFCTLCVHI